MGAKDISKTMTLKDGVSGTLKKISSGTVRYKKDLHDLRKQGDATWRSMRMGLTGLAGVAAGYLGFNAVVSFLSDSANAAKDAIEAETKLAAVLKNVKGVTDAQVNSLKNYAAQLQNVGVVDGDVITSGVQQVGTFQLQAATIKKLMPGMADLLAQQKGLNATQQDAVSIGNLIGKAMTGNVGSLSKVGVTFSAAQKQILKFGTEEQRAATLAEVLKQNVGGVNAALAQTDQGKIQQASNAWGDMKETIGAVVLLIKGQFAQAFMSHLPEIQTGVQGIADSIRTWVENGGVERIVNGLERIGVAAADTYNFFKNNWSTIAPIIIGIAGAFSAYKLALLGVRAMTVLTAAATFIMTTAQLGLNVAIRANPLGFMITLMGLLVTVGILVIQNWEQVKLALMRTWNVVVGAAEWGVNKYFEYANFMLKVYKFAFDSIEFAGISIWNGIITAGQAGVNGFIGLIETMIDKSLNGINRLIRSANSASNALGLGDVTSEIKFGGLGRVDFSGAKANAVAPKWDSDFNPLPKVDFSGAKFSEDSIMSQTRKAQSERDKKKGKSEDALVQAVQSNTDAMNQNTSATGANTSATNKNSATLKGNQGTMDIADMLLGRIERHLYAT